MRSVLENYSKKKHLKHTIGYLNTIALTHPSRRKQDERPRLLESTKVEVSPYGEETLIYQSPCLLTVPQM